jgi:hypothetical protein
VERIFGAELDALDGSRRATVLAALVAASAWTSWESLRAHQGLSAERAQAAMRFALASLLGEG